MKSGTASNPLYASSSDFTQDSGGQPILHVEDLVTQLRNGARIVDAV